MKVLGIDTATPVASVALVEDGELVKEKVFPASEPNTISPALPRSNHAEILFPLIERLFDETGISWGGISAIAVSIGPGSFTGLRIGVSAAKGLAYGWNIPLVGVSTLLAVATRVREWNGWICPLLDAKKREVYAALFRREGDSVNRVMDDAAASPDKILHWISSKIEGEHCLFVGSGSRLYADAIREALGSKAKIPSDDSYFSIAFSVAKIGEAKVLVGEGGSAGPLVPQYVRPSEAELGLNSGKLTGGSLRKPIFPLTKITP